MQFIRFYFRKVRLGTPKEESSYQRKITEIFRRFNKGDALRKRSSKLGIAIAQSVRTQSKSDSELPQAKAELDSKKASFDKKKCEHYMSAPKAPDSADADAVITPLQHAVQPVLASGDRETHTNNSVCQLVDTCGTPQISISSMVSLHDIAPYLSAQCAEAVVHSLEKSQCTVIVLTKLFEKYREDILGFAEYLYKEYDISIFHSMLLFDTLVQTKKVPIDLKSHDDGEDGLGHENE